MRIEPTIDEVVYGRRGMLTGIEVVLHEECMVSAVTLMFAAIDALSALSRPVDQSGTNKRIFMNWVNRYMLPSSALSCTADDLYGARCGVLHTYSPASSLHDKGEARQIFYEWRNGPSADSGTPVPPGALIVEVEGLHAALKRGIRAFLQDAELDRDIRGRVQSHLPSLLCYAPWPQLSVQVA